MNIYNIYIYIYTYAYLCTHTYKYTHIHTNLSFTKIPEYLHRGHIRIAATTSLRW